MNETPPKRPYRSQNDQVERAMNAQDRTNMLLETITKQNSDILNEARLSRQTIVDMINKFSDFQKSIQDILNFQSLR